jgi:hypothetical protein
MCNETKEDAMHYMDSEELIQMEVEQIAEDLCGASYFDLSPELKQFVRLRAINLLWPTDAREGFVAAA